MLPARSRVTRLLGSGRSSEVSQKSNECLAMSSGGQAGADGGAPGLSVAPSSFPTKEIVANGNLHSLEPKLESLSGSVFWKAVRVGTLGEGHQHRVDMAHVVA